MNWCRAVFLAALASASGPAFCQTVVMGHHLGETVPQFLAAEPALAGRIDNCRATEPGPMTPEQIHALSKQDAYALGRQLFTRVSQSPDAGFSLTGVPSQGLLEDLARRGVAITFDKRMPDEIATCHALLALTAPPGPSPVSIDSLPHTRPRPVTWRFANGTLSQIDIDFHGADFAEVAGDLTAKVGAPPGDNEEIDTPNLYGAILHVRRKASWLTPELYALLESDQGTADGQMHLSVITRADYDIWAKAHARKSTLD